MHRGRKLKERTIKSIVARIGIKVQAGGAFRTGRGSYQVADSQAERSADVERVPGSSLAELSLSDLCGELSGGSRTSSDE